MGRTMNQVVRKSASSKDAGFEDFFVSIESSLVENGMLDDYMYFQELKQRKLFLNGEIDDETVMPIVKAILRYNKEDANTPADERKPIILHINTVGGDVDSGHQLIDAMIESKTPVYVVNTSKCYSMGFLIYIAGKKRYATKNAKFLLHDGTTIVGDSSSKARDRMEFNDRIEARLRDAVLAWTSITKDEYIEHSRQEWYMFADDAKKYGVVDEIIGVDCDIDVIV